MDDKDNIYSDGSAAQQGDGDVQDTVASASDAYDDGYSAIPLDAPSAFSPIPDPTQIDSSNIEDFLAQFQMGDSPASEDELKKDTNSFSNPDESTFIPVGAYVPQAHQGVAQEPSAEKRVESSFNPYASNGAYHQSQPRFSQQPFNVAPSQQGYTAPNAPQSGGNKGKIIAFIAIALCLLVAGFFVFTGLGDDKGKETTQQTQQTTAEKAPEVSVNTQQSPSAPSLENVNSVWVAKKVRPSVVGVMTYIDGQLAGEGSGVVWAEDSTGQYTYIVTCAHVIDESGATFGILLLDGSRYEAEMVATDVRTDIGVLKVKATGLPKAEFGDSSALEIGEPIYAIGNPGGSEFFGSFTDGVVSGIDRSISATYTMTCVQHSAAINPGNSGGALVNTSGQVIGINSSKIASTDYEGMGFAVPMSIVKPVVDALIQYRYVPNRPKLGIEYADVSTYQLYSMVVSIKGLPQGSLVIAGISSDSSLANTEAQVGDLIIGVNGKDMDDSSVLLDLIDTGAVGDTLTLTLCRIEKRTYKTTTFDVTITLVEDKGNTVKQEETTAVPEGDYNYGGSGSFEDFFRDYFGFGW